MRILIFLCFFISFLFGVDIKPKLQLKTDSAVLDIAIGTGKIVGCSAKGDVFEIGKGLKKLYSLPQIETPYGEKRAQKAFSVDISPSGRSIAIAAEDGSLYIGSDGKLVKTSFFTNSIIKKVSFVDENLLLIGMISAEMVLFDKAKNKTLYSSQIGSSPLSDFALKEDRKTAAVAGEAGIVYLIDTMSGKIKRAYKNINLDNIYKIDYKNSNILTAGQDRKATLVSDSGVVKARFAGKFLIYAVALSPSGKRAAVAIDEQNNIAVFDTTSKSELFLAKGHTATLNRIVFANENKMVSVADENKILIWEIK